MSARNQRGPATSMPIQSGDKRVDVTEQDNDVTTSIAGANGWETIWDLSPGTDLYYWLLKEDHPQLGSGGNLKLRMQLPQDGGGSTEIGDNAEIRIVARGPEANETGDKLGRVYRYREFSQANQFDNEDVNRIRLDKNVEITEAAHLEIQVNNSTNGNDVDLSQSGGYLTLEMFRGTES